MESGIKRKLGPKFPFPSGLGFCINSRAGSARLAHHSDGLAELRLAPLLPGVLEQVEDGRVELVERGRLGVTTRGHHGHGEDVREGNRGALVGEVMVGQLDQRPAVKDLAEPVEVRLLVSEVDREGRLGGPFPLFLDLLNGFFGVGEGVDREDANGITRELALRR